MKKLKLKGWVGWNPRCAKGITIYKQDAERWRAMGLRVIPVTIVERKES